MRRIRALWIRLRGMFGSGKANKEFAAELESHLQMHIDDNLRSGMTQEEARRQALIKLGGIEQTKQVYRERSLLPPLENLLRDVRFAFRQLRKDPGFALMAVLTLALGIGATTLIFAIVYGAVIDPYPYRDANRIVQMAFRDKQGIRGFMAVNGDDFEIVRRSALVEDAMLTDFADPITSIDGYPEDVRAALLSGNAFGFLGVAPLFGRALTEQDGNQPVVVLGYEFCRRHFTCDVKILGHRLDLDHRLYTIVGVMPQRFVWENAAIYLHLMPGNGADESYPLYLRPRKGVASGAFSSGMLALVRQFVLASDGVNLPAETRLTAEPLAQRRGSATEKRVELLLASAFVLLLIACANASILLSGRAAAREHEFSIRRALGAGRGRVMRQLLTEAMLLAFCGGALGVALAYGGIAVLRAPLVRSFFPSEAVLSLNHWVLAFSTLISVATGVLFGLMPGLQVSRTASEQRAITLHATGATQRSRAHRMLILLQVSLTLVLLVTAITPIRAFVGLYRLDLGYDPHHVLSFWLPVPEGEYSAWAQRVQYYASLREQLQAIPGVTAASVDEAMPTGGGFQMEYGLPSEVWGADMDVKMPRADLEFVDPQYLTTMRIPVVAGRPFTQDEFARAESVALINRSFAHRLFGTENPIGHLLRVPPLAAGYAGVMRPAHPSEYVRIIGVTSDVLAAWSTGAPPRETLYLPESLFAGTSNIRVQLRASGDPLLLLETARRVVHKLNPDQPISQARTLDDILSEDLRSRDRWLAVIFGTFAGLALFLAAVGLYSVLSFAVTQRTREIGVRVALGASRQDILWATLFPEMRVVLMGIGIGIAASLALKKLIETFLVSRSGDAWVLPTSAAVLMATALVASYLSARRAISVDPMQALRTE